MTWFPKRMWGIRHIRYCLTYREFWLWWVDVGQYAGAIPNISDLEYLDAIWRGDA